jgi:hypothetical protein
MDLAALSRPDRRRDLIRLRVLEQQIAPQSLSHHAVVVDHQDLDRL